MTMTRNGTFDRFAAPYDRGMAPLEKLWLRQMRQHLVAHARGRVLEVGVGTGANMPFYEPSVSLTAVDESPDMLEVAAARAQTIRLDTGLGQSDIEHLSFASDSFDTVLASLVLCSVVDQSRAFSELHRVLRRPGGKLLLLEHMQPRVRPLARLIELANVPWCAIQDRCHLNRDTQGALAEHGFEIEWVEAKMGGFLRLIAARLA
jgi:ubiquinone/menaquinone biosynthesis C-methylase UbiE